MRKARCAKKQKPSAPLTGRINSTCWIRTSENSVHAKFVEWNLSELRSRPGPARVGCPGVRQAPISGKDHVHPHLAREAIVRDVETTRYGRDYAGRRGNITHVDKDPQTGAATRYVVRMENGGNEVRFESEEIRIMEAWD